PLKLDVGLYKFKSTSLSNIVITSNQISLNEVTLYTTPTPSPVTWFTWDGTTATGLSSEGLKQTKLVLPEFTTNIGVNFLSQYNKSSTDYCKVQSIDFSFTKITQFVYNTKGSFQGCRDLREIVFPPNLNYIGSYTFSECTSLTSIVLPNTITTMYGNIFRGCIALETITLSNLCNSPFGEYNFYGCSSLKNIILNGVKPTTIGNSTFYNCSNLVNFNIPSTITTIGQYAFNNTGIRTINIPSSMKAIEHGVFYNCHYLSSVTIPNSVTSISSYSFYYCDKLTSLFLPNNLQSLGTAAFQLCTSLTEVTLPNSLTSIGDWVFSNSNSTTPINPNFVIYVNSTTVENLIKPKFSGTIINFARP
ncbi:MAG: leucine-rich repeat domain-containing protein, partial [Ureaplasma sp.]|nr:leucine-rich repeat domain-containing protein [Ureaplasma sp.]